MPQHNSDIKKKTEGAAEEKTTLLRARWLFQYMYKILNSTQTRACKVKYEVRNAFVGGRVESNTRKKSASGKKGTMTNYL